MNEIEGGKKKVVHEEFISTYTSIQYFVTNSGNWKLTENPKYLTGEALIGKRNLVSLQRNTSV